MIKEERKKKKRRRAGFYLFLFFVLLVGAGALIVTQVFTVEQVVVEGNELYDSSQIESMILDDDYSWNSLYVYLKYRFKDIGEVPFVDTMEVSLDNPHTVHVKVYEKGMLGYLYISSIGRTPISIKMVSWWRHRRKQLPGFRRLWGFPVMRSFYMRSFH